MKKTQLFSEKLNSLDTPSLKINRDFEKRYLHNKKRVELERLEAKHGKADDFVEDSEDLVSEDSEGDLLRDDELVLDFMNTFSKIKHKSDEIYNKETTFYRTKQKHLEGEISFQRPKQPQQKQPRNLKRLFLEQHEPEETVDRAEPTPVEVQAQLKEDFKAAFGVAGDEPDSEINGTRIDSFGGDFLRKKSHEEAIGSSMDFQEFLKKHAKKVKQSEIDLIKKTFLSKNTESGDEAAESKAQLETASGRAYKFRPPGSGAGSNDKFLMNYIVNRRWLEDRNIFQDDRWKEVDEQDEWYHQIAEQKEHEYNLRFEVGGYKEGNKQVRRDEHTQRQLKQSKRKTRENLKKQRRQEESERLQREQELLVEMRREEMRNKILKLVREGGNKPIAEPVLEELLDNALKKSKEQALDYLMDKLFGEEYFGERDELRDDDILEYLNEVEENFDRNEDGDSEDEIGEEALDQVTEAELAKQGDLGADFAETEKAQNETGPAHIWWYCDQCKRGIQPGKLKFECKECPDFTLCRLCHRKVKHEHKFAKSKVPAESVPPADDEILRLLDLQKACCVCQDKVFREIGYYVHEAEADEAGQASEYYYCLHCFSNLEDVGKGYKLVSMSKEPLDGAMRDNPIRGQLQNILEEEMEQKPSDGFEYVDVPANDFGLTDSELLYADERILNQVFSTKRMVSFKDVQVSGRDKVRMRKLRNVVKKSASINQKLIEKMMKLDEQEAQLKAGAGKSKQALKKYDNFVQNKAKLIAKLENNAMTNQERICEMLGMKLKKKQKEDDDRAVAKEQPEVVLDPNLKISSKRLSYYNLK